MPLYALDKNGRVYQTEGVGDADLGVGYYADDMFGDESSVYFGEVSKRADRAKAANKRKQLLLLKRRRQIAEACKARVAAQDRRAIAKNQAEAKAVRQAQERKRIIGRNRYMKAIRDSRNPMGQIESQFMGDAMSGFGDHGEAIMNSEAMANADLAGDYEMAEPFGNTMFGEYEDEGMGGFKIKKVFKRVAKAAGKVVSKANPIALSTKIMTKLPIVKGVYRAADKLTGGTLTTIDRVSKLPGRALQGEKIGKAEFMEAAMLLIKVGAIVVTGGGAAAVIGASATTLKGGVLGKTSLGRNLLSLVEVATLSSVANQAMSKILEKKAQEMIVAKAASAAGKRAGALGGIAISIAGTAAFAGAGGGSTGAIKADANLANTVAKNSEVAANKAAEVLVEETKKGAIKFSTERALEVAKAEVMVRTKQEVAKAFEKKTGIPLDLATRVARGDIPTPAEVEKRVKEKMEHGLDEAQADLARTVAQIPTSEPAMRAILEKKQQVLDVEIKKHVAIVEAVQTDAAKTLVAVNTDLVKKLESANAQKDITTKIAAQLKLKADEFNRAGTNADAKNRLLPEMKALEALLYAENIKFEKMADIAWKASDRAKVAEDIGAIRVAQAELSPKSKNIRNEFSHPLLYIG